MLTASGIFVFKNGQIILNHSVKHQLAGFVFLLELHQPHIGFLAGAGVVQRAVVPAGSELKNLRIEFGDDLYLLRLRVEYP